MSYLGNGSVRVGDGECQSGGWVVSEWGWVVLDAVLSGD